MHWPIEKIKGLPNASQGALQYRRPCASVVQVRRYSPMALLVAAAVAATVADVVAEKSLLLVVARLSLILSHFQCYKLLTSTLLVAQSTISLVTHKLHNNFTNQIFKNSRIKTSMSN